MKMASTSSMRPMRLAISGGGPAGLTLAGILSREGRSGAFDITVFERNKENSDQGGGWDMDKDAQDSLTRAGLDVSSIQRKGSDTMRFYKIQDTKHPICCMRMPPSLLSKFGIRKDQIGLDEINLETDRTKLIDGLTASLGQNVKVNYESYISGARRSEENDDGCNGNGNGIDGGSGIELLGHNGSSLGKFDVIVDASGARSPLRNCRFSPNADSFYAGATIIQYLVKSPEKFWDKDIVDCLGEGTLGLYGPTMDGKGTEDLIIQRYGAKKMDQMVNIGIFAYDEEPNQVAKELGCEGIHGITRNKDIVKRVIDYAKRRLSNDNWSQKYRDMFDSAEGIRILPIHMHPSQVETMNNILPGSDDLPFIGIGDALHALPPWSGMSGNYALADAADLASALLLIEQEQQEKSPSWTPGLIATMLRGQEKKFLKRTEERREHAFRTGKFMKDYKSSTTINDFDMVSLFLGKKFQWSDPESVIVSTFLSFLTLLNRWDNYGVPITKN